MIKLLLSAIMAVAILLPASALAQAKSACGDVNDDGTLNIGDLTYMINWLYLSGPPPPDPSAADMDLCPGVDVGDIDYLLHFMFFGGPAPCVGPTDCTPYPGGEISLDYVDGELTPGVISIDHRISFFLRLTNNTPDVVTALSGGFRVHSPDGAFWMSTEADTVMNGGFDLVMIETVYGTPGSGDDTVGVTAIALSFGMPPGFDDVVYKISVGPFSAADIGKTICLDTAFFGLAGEWKWSVDGVKQYIPNWPGAYCFTIGEPPLGETSISLDHVTGYSPGANGLWAGVPITYHLRMKNLTDQAIAGFTSGFKIHSPDGATWQAAVGDTVSRGWWDRFDLLFDIYHHSCNGMGADTVGFAGAAMTGTGLETGYDEVSLLVRTEVDAAQEGKILCLDSTFFPPNGYWLWALETAVTAYPSWDGPHCFEILGAPPGGGDSLIVPSVTVDAGNMVQPVYVKLLQPIKGVSIPLKIPVGVEVDSLSRIGLLTEGWDYAFSSVQSDSGFLHIALANSMGASIPPGEHPVFNIHFRSLNGDCDAPVVLSWDTTMSSDPVRSLLFADVNGQDVVVGFDRERDLTHVPPYGPGDMNSDGAVDIGDLVFMVDYMFHGGPPPAILNSMDVNGSCTGPNIADLVYFVDYFFQGGPPSVCGCLGEGGSKIAINDAITLSAVYENDVTAIILESPGVLRGLEVELIGQADGAPVNLFSDHLDLVYGFAGDRLRIGLLDLNGGETIEAGTHRIVEIPGRWEIGSALVAADGRRAQGVRVNSAVGGTTMPSTYTLHQNYPNPFNPQTQIDFSLPFAGHVKLEVFNVMGQKIAVLVDGQLEAGAHSAVFDGRTTASGVYFYKLETSGISETKKMVLLK